MTWLYSRFSAFAVGLACVLVAPDALAQPLAYRDNEGVWRWTHVSGEPSLVAKSTNATETMGSFRVTFEDVDLGNGVGFDDPNAGAARRATLRAVLQYLSAILDVRGTADIVVFESDTDGTGALASAGPLLQRRVGFQGGLVFEHLTTGSDPRGDAPDGTVSVDFGFEWNSDRDLPTETEFDLYTGLLHEVTHALGFFSAVGEDGRSELLNDGSEGLFSFLDSFLFRSADERFLYLAGGEINSENDDALSADLFFNAPLAISAFGESPQVFAPRMFFEGSSIAHWDPSVGADAVMLPILSRGNLRRELTPWEIQVLGDLGYDLRACVDPVDGATDCEVEVPDDPGVDAGPGVVGGNPPDEDSGSFGTIQESGGCQVASGRNPIGAFAFGVILLLGVCRRGRPRFEEA